MKTFNLAAAIIMLFFSASSVTAQQKITVGTENGFLLNAFNSRMIATNEAKMAASRSNSAAIRQFGKQMVKDENLMYADIKELGAQANVPFPKSVDEIATPGRMNLSGVSRAAFDSKYVSLTTADLEKEIALFKQAANSDSSEISEFAKKYIPLLESQLATVRTFR